MWDIVTALILKKKKSPRWTGWKHSAGTVSSLLWPLHHGDLLPHHANIPYRLSPTPPSHPISLSTPQTSELIRALQELENAASGDSVLRQRISSLPAEVQDASLLHRITGGRCSAVIFFFFLSLGYSPVLPRQTPVAWSTRSRQIFCDHFNLLKASTLRPFEGIAVQCEWVERGDPYWPLMLSADPAPSCLSCPFR